MFAPGEVLDPAVDRLAQLAGGGPALELAVGTGRIAIPLVGRGVPVTGIGLSTSMVEQLRTKADERTIPVVIGDMASTRAPGSFSLAYLVCNTISDLLSPAEQVACFRDAARHLLPGGGFVIELWVPEQDLAAGPVGERLQDRTGLHRRGHDRRPPPAGGCPPLRVRSDTRACVFCSPHRYVWPGELDLMAALAGFEPESRHGDWSGGPSTADFVSHVSVYRLSTAP